MTTGHHISKQGTRIGFDRFQDPYKSAFNKAGQEANKHGYELRTKITDDRYEKIISFWFFNPSTKHSGEVFKARKAQEVIFTTYSLNI